MNRDEFECDDISVLRDCLQELAACEELNTVPLPSPDLIWWRAQLAEKRSLARRSVRSINAVRAAAIVVSTVFALLASFLWAPRVFADLPLPLPLTIASLLLFTASTGSVLLIWARQR